MKVATWNVNSIRARLERLVAFLRRHDPDVVCLQETKVTDDAFPSEDLAELGYRSTPVGQKTYNGVALLSKQAPLDVLRGFDDGGDESQARLVGGTVEGVRCIGVYVPNGRTVGSEAYAYKLDWMQRLRRLLESRHDPQQELLICGDFNVAPADIDVHDPDAWRDEVLCSEPERKALSALQEWGLVDGFRALYPERVAYSWWDYRRLGFPKNRGLRIDHILLTRPLFERCSAIEIDREERKGKGASDHAPVLASFD